MRTLLIDADIPAYQIAARCEQTFDFDGDGENIAVDLSPEKIGPMVEKEIEACCKATDSDEVVVCLSDPSGRYFRQELDETYKANRKAARKPELLQAVKNYLAAEYPYYVRPRLEADDVMGILATHPKIIEGEKVMCSSDKDLLTIPGLLYNPNKPDAGVIEQSRLDSHRFHMYQTIVGDATDNYPGAKGVSDGGKWTKDGFEEGPRSLGFAFDVLFAEDGEELWDIVVHAYAHVGQTEEQAIHQARLARILRAEDYNFKTRKVRLWNPLKLLY